MVYGSPLLAIALMLIGGFLVFFALGVDPIEGFTVYFYQPVSDIYGIAELFFMATPLMLCAIGLARMACVALKYRCSVSTSDGISV